MTLSETAQMTKKVIVYAGIALLIIGVIWAAVAYYLATRPVEVVFIPPTQGFGILPKTPLPKSKLTASSVSYDLDTETGSLPDKLPDRMNVYHIPKQGVTFSSPQKAKRTASAFSFKNGPVIVSPTIHKFTDDKGGELIYDLDSSNFRLKRPIATKSAEFEDRPFETMEQEQELISAFRRYLNDQGVLNVSLSNGKTSVVYNKTKFDDSTEAAITLWQEDIAEGQEPNIIKYPIVTPDFNEGLVRGVVTKYQSPENKYIALDYIYWGIDTSKAETYPIKPVQQAFEQLQAGEGVTVMPYSRSSVAIEKVYLAYLLPKEYTKFLQPVYVFEGPGFAAYVPAITPENFEP